VVGYHKVKGHAYITTYTYVSRP